MRKRGNITMEDRKKIKQTLLVMGTVCLSVLTFVVITEIVRLSAQL